jgi:hypothetical protein
MSMLQVNLMHVFLIGPVLFGIGYKNPGENMELYNYLTMLTLTMLFIVRIPFYNLIKWEYYDYLKASHLLLFTSFFGWVAYKKDTAPEFVYHILKLLGIAVISTHLYLAATKLI